MNKTFKRRAIVIAAVVFALLLILFLPIPEGEFKDGGTRVWSALTYKVVDWNRLYDGGRIYNETKVYFLPDNFKDLDELFETEIA